MNEFAALLDALLFTPSRNSKLRLMKEYFAGAPDPERGWALAALTGELVFDEAKPNQATHNPNKPKQAKKNQDKKKQDDKNPPPQSSGGFGKSTGGSLPNPPPPTRVSDYPVRFPRLGSM